MTDCLKDHAVNLNKQKKYFESLHKLNEALEKYVTDDYALKYSLYWWKVFFKLKKFYYSAQAFYFNENLIT
jgi:hypothetical protein